MAKKQQNKESEHSDLSQGSGKTISVWTQSLFWKLPFLKWLGEKESIKNMDRVISREKFEEYYADFLNSDWATITWEDLWISADIPSNLHKDIQFYLKEHGIEESHLGTKVSELAILIQEFWKTLG